VCEDVRLPAEAVVEIWRLSTLRTVRTCLCCVAIVDPHSEQACHDAVTVLDNPTHFTNPFQFEITFECLEPLNDGACFSCLRKPVLARSVHAPARWSRPVV